MQKCRNFQKGKVVLESFFQSYLIDRMLDAGVVEPCGSYKQSDGKIEAKMRVLQDFEIMPAEVCDDCDVDTYKLIDETITGWCPQCRQTRGDIRTIGRLMGG